MDFILRSELSTENSLLVWWIRTTVYETVGQGSIPWRATETDGDVRLIGKAAWLRTKYLWVRIPPSPLPYLAFCVWFKDPVNSMQRN